MISSFRQVSLGFLRAQWLSETTWIGEDDSQKRGKTTTEHNVDIAINILMFDSVR